MKNLVFCEFLSYSMKSPPFFHAFPAVVKAGGMEKEKQHVKQGLNDSILFIWLVLSARNGQRFNELYDRKGWLNSLSIPL